MRLSLRLSLFAGLVVAALLSFSSSDASGAETLLQCMQKCITYEGGNSDTNKATCKTRCGAAMVNQKPAGMRDCRGEVKACRSKCGKEKIGNPSPCHKQCKELQMTCL
jgi:hypothetical protein